MGLVIGGGSSSAPSVTAGGNLGAARSDTMTAAPKWITGTLNANHVATITALAGGHLKYLLTQDATGGRSFSISDGTPTVVNISAEPSTTSIVDVFSDGTNLFVTAV